VAAQVDGEGVVEDVERHRFDGVVALRAQPPRRHVGGIDVHAVEAAEVFHRRADQRVGPRFGRDERDRDGVRRRDDVGRDPLRVRQLPPTATAAFLAKRCGIRRFPSRRHNYRKPVLASPWS
jgi:hypothetical protein